MHSNNLINEKIAAFYVDVAEADCQHYAGKFFNANYTLNFKEILSLILSDVEATSENEVIKDFKTLSYGDFLQIYNKIKPILKRSQTLLDSVNIKQLNLDWLRDKSYVLQVFERSPTNSNEHGTESVEKILLLTAMLEFALGSIFYTISDSRTPPHLLKDLLCTKELEIFFGLEALTFLKLIMGTPKAINLRNIVWHGFPKPEAIPTYYVSTLLLIIHSFGHMLQAKEFKITYRQQVKDFSSSLATVCQVANIPANFTIDEQIYYATLAHCQLIPEDYKAYWIQLHSYFQTEEYWRFVLLILPQLELILRLLYANSNCFDVSAKLDEYYITLDTIFEPAVPNSANQQNSFFSDTSNISIGVMHFMYDIFLAPKGPRLRDKISHGEVSMIASNDQQLCQLLLYLAFNLITQNEKDYPLAKYESQFHMNSLAKESLNKACKTCNDFKQTFEINLEMDSSLVFIKTNVPIFQRPKKEQLYMNLLLKIANLISNTCHNLEESIRLRQTLLAEHELHSKRRRTLENIIKMLPKFCCCLELALKCLLEIYEELQISQQDFEDDDAVCLQRFLKHTLRITENFVSYSHKDSNEWIKITELCGTFDDIHKRWFLKYRRSSKLS